MTQPNMSKHVKKASYSASFSTSTCLLVNLLKCLLACFEEEDKKEEGGCFEFIEIFCVESNKSLFFLLLRVFLLSFGSTFMANLVALNSWGYLCSEQYNLEKLLCLLACICIALNLNQYSIKKGMYDNLQ